METPRRFTIGLVQMRCVREPRENLAQALAGIDQAAREGASLICLPEMFRSEYFCQQEDAEAFDLAEPIPGETTDAVARVARERGVAVVVPLFERRAPGVYHNSAVVVDADGRIVGHYRKMHIPDDPGYYEKFYFAPGDLGFAAIDTRAGRIGVLICWDQWFPEAARLVALHGATVLFYPTAIGWHPAEKQRHGATQRQAWQTVQRGHAIANGTYVAAVNRVGHETPSPDQPGIEFWGSSFLCDPQGVVVAEAAVDRPEVLVGEVDLEHLEQVRRHWPFLRDRRIDAYGDLNRRFLDE